MRKINFLEGLTTEIIVKDGITYKLKFEKGIDDLAWCLIEKEDELIFQHFLFVTKVFDVLVNIPFKIMIYGNEDELVTASKLVDDKIEIFIDD